MLRRTLGVTLVVCAPLAAWGQGAVRPLTQRDLQGKSVEQLYLMRNEIYARHGKPFKTFELDQYFRGHKWYKPKLAYSDARLSATERQNAALILEREKALLKENLLGGSGGPRLNVANIFNRRQFGELSPGELATLSRQGVLVVPAEHEQFFHLYEDNSYRGVGSFITTDAVLQLYHVFFDFTLRSLEQEKLLPIAEDLTHQMVEGSRELAQTARDPRVKDAALRNLAFFSIAEAILTDGKATPDPSVAETVEAEVAKIKAHARREHCLVFPSGENAPRHDLDYTQFIPRGHYTRTPALSRYFLGLMWYGLAGFVSSTQAELDAALVMTWLLNQPAPAGAATPVTQWLRIYEPTTFFVGLSDDVGLDDLWPEIQRIGGASPSPEALLAAPAYAQLKSAVERIASQKTRVVPAMEDIPGGAQVRFMGQRYLPDSEILQRLCNWPERPIPKGLDVAAVLGSAKARAILLDELQEAKDWAGYPARLATVADDFSRVGPETWRQNLYWGWLWCLKALYQPPTGKTVPFFTTTDGWARKDLNTSLASWAELRHDTILYGKQSGMECGGEEEEWVPDPPKGFVEPNPEFFGRLADLLKVTREGLQRRDLLIDRIRGSLESFDDLAAFLKRMAQKELAGETLTPEENAQIVLFGSNLEMLTLSVISDDNISGWYLVEDNADKRIAVVADVHTSGAEVLEEAVGPAFEIFVVVEIDGYLKLLRGAVFTYHEFTWPSADRLTDEAWQKMLREGQAPPLPAWIKPILSDRPTHEMPRPPESVRSPYSSGC